MLVWWDESDEKHNHHAAERVEIAPVMRAGVPIDDVRPIK